MKQLLSLPFPEGKHQADQHRQEGGSSHSRMFAYSSYVFTVSEGKQGVEKYTVENRDAEKNVFKVFFSSLSPKGDILNKRDFILVYGSRERERQSIMVGRHGNRQPEKETEQLYLNLKQTAKREH